MVIQLKKWVQNGAELCKIFEWWKWCGILWNIWIDGTSAEFFEIFNLCTLSCPSVLRISLRDDGQYPAGNFAKCFKPVAYRLANLLSIRRLLWRNINYLSGFWRFHFCIKRHGAFGKHGKGFLFAVGHFWLIFYFSISFWMKFILIVFGYICPLNGFNHEESRMLNRLFVIAWHFEMGLGCILLAVSLKGQ